MAVFRAASWTVAGGSSSTRAHGTVYADQFPGATADAQIAAAQAAISGEGGIIDATGYGSADVTLAAPLQVGTTAKKITLRIGPMTRFHFHFTGSNTTDGLTVENGSSVEIAGINYYGVNDGNSGPNGNFVVDSGTTLRCEIAPARRDGTQQAWALRGITFGIVKGAVTQGMLCEEGTNQETVFDNIRMQPYGTLAAGGSIYSGMFIDATLANSPPLTADFVVINSDINCFDQCTHAALVLKTTGTGQITNAKFIADFIQHPGGSGPSYLPIVSFEPAAAGNIRTPYFDSVSFETTNSGTSSAVLIDGATAARFINPVLTKGATNFFEILATHASLDVCIDGMAGGPYPGTAVLDDLNSVTIPYLSAAGNYGRYCTPDHFDSLGTLRLVPRAFSSVAACAAGTEGAQASVTDSTTNTWGATIAGTGANHVLGYCDGTHWTVAGK